jgi:hypothetical protein
VDSAVGPRRTPPSPPRGSQRHCAEGITGAALVTRHWRRCHRHPRVTLLSKRPPRMRVTDHHGVAQPPATMEDAIHAMEPPALGNQGGPSRPPAHALPSERTTRSGYHVPQRCLALSIATGTSSRPRSERREGGGAPPPSLTRIRVVPVAASSAGEVRGRDGSGSG